MPPAPCYHYRVNRKGTMLTISNPYAQQIREQGKDPSTATAPRKTFPCTIGLRYFETEEEYNEALADFLNGY